jgi:hypothetical protein
MTDYPIPDATIKTETTYCSVDRHGVRDAKITRVFWLGGKVAIISDSLIEHELQISMLVPGQRFSLFGLNLIALEYDPIRCAYFVTRRRGFYWWFKVRQRIRVFLSLLKYRIIGTFHVWGLADYRNNPTIRTYGVIPRWRDIYLVNWFLRRF